MEGPPLGPGGEDITWPDQVAPRGRKASSTRKIKPQTSNPRTPDCVMAEARIPEFFGESQIRVQVLDFMGLGSCMPREAWRLPSPGMLQKNSGILASAMTFSECLFFSDARFCHGRGKDHRTLWRNPNSSSSVGFHGIGVVHAKGSLEVALPLNASKQFCRRQGHQGGVTACGLRRHPDCRSTASTLGNCRSYGPGHQHDEGGIPWLLRWV